MTTQYMAVVRHAEPPYPRGAGRTRGLAPLSVGGKEILSKGGAMWRR